MANSPANRSSPYTQKQEFLLAYRPTYHLNLHRVWDADSQSYLPSNSTRLYGVAGRTHDAPARIRLDRLDVFPGRYRTARLRYPPSGNFGFLFCGTWTLAAGEP